MVDWGMHNSDSLARLGFTSDKLAGPFFTHYHIDHTAGYADLLSKGSLRSSGDRLWLQNKCGIYGGFTRGGLSCPDQKKSRLAASVTQRRTGKE